MPIQKLPAEFAGHTAYTGIMDLRQPGSDQTGIEFLKRVNFQLYDIGAEHGKLLLNGLVSLGTLRSSAADFGDEQINIQPNDIVTIITNEKNDDLFIYNHTSSFYAFTNHISFSYIAKRVAFAMIFGACMTLLFFPTLVAGVVFFFYFQNNKKKVMKKMREFDKPNPAYAQMAEWVKQNCSPQRIVHEQTVVVQTQTIQSI